MRHSTLFYSFMNIVLSIVFISMICLPLIGSVLGLDVTKDLGEKRTLTAFPSLGQDTISVFTEKFESFYSDHFGFRNGLIQGHNWIRYRLFKGSSLGQVLFGKNDWLFLTKAGIIPDFLGQNPLTKQDLDLWKNVLEQRQQYFQNRGIHFLFVIAPNKATIYPEMLPDHISKNRGRSRMDQLMEHLKKHSNINFLDVRENLVQAKHTGLLYHPKDSHWTDRGAFIVYKEFCARLKEWFPDIQPLSEDDFTVIKTKGADDLSMMLGLGRELEEDSEGLILKTPASTSRKQLNIPGGYEWTRSIAPEDQIIIENEKGKHRLLMFHDSFTTRGGLRELLGELFKHSTFASIDPEEQFLELLIKQEQPDVVIYEIVERKLRDLPSASTALPSND
jgi:alginate O-acetyltransferase complex protein AlgJ